MFADATGDHQWIHVDPEKATERAVRHHHCARVHDAVAAAPADARDVHRRRHQDGINYGLNKVRFPSPVPVGSKVRATSTLVGAEDVGKGTVQLTVSTTIEIEGGTKPACVAESILRYIG